MCARLRVRLGEQVRTSGAAQGWLTDEAALVGVDDVLDAVAQVEFPSWRRGCLGGEGPWRGQGLEAECLGDEDDGDAGGGFVVDDECLREHCSGEAGVLHAGELAREAVLA